MAKRKTGTLKKSPNGKWLYIYLTIDGKQSKAPGSWPNTPEGRAEAHRHKSRLLGLDADGQLVAPGETVASYVETWIAKLAYKVEGGHIDQYTADNYASAARSKLAETPLGAMRLTDVDADDIESHYAYLLRSGGRGGKPLSRKSVKNLASISSMVFQSAKRAKKIVANPCADVAAPIKDRVEKRTWAATVCAEFLKLTADHPFGLIWRVIAVTGLRRSEALGLRWSMTDLDQPEGESVVVGVIRWNKQRGVHYRPFPKTTESRRWVAFEEGTTKLLRKHRADEAARRLEMGPDWAGDLDLIFTDEMGRALHPDRVGRAFQDEARRLGFEPIGLHGLRHSLATAGLDQRKLTKVVSTLLGHSSTTVTEDIYQHMGRMEFKKEAVELGRLMATGE
jgi:integrase